MEDELLSSVGAQDLDTSSYQLSNLEEIEFNWEDPAVDMVSVHQLGIDTPISTSTFDDFQMGSTTANPIIKMMMRKTMRIQFQKKQQQQQRQQQSLSVQPDLPDY